MNMKLYISIFLVLISTVAFGQVEFSAELSSKTIGMNERLRVDFKMNRNGDNFTPPDFKDFEVYGGPRQAISRSWTNGVSSFNKTYTYFLKPKHRGTLTIGQAEVEVEGKTYKTSPRKVEVTAAVDKPRDGNNSPIVNVSDKVHLVVDVSNSKPYLNEGITVLYKLYVKEGTSVSNWRTTDMPRYPNFWSHDIPVKSFNVKYGSYQGDKNYRYVVIKKVVLYPQKTGDIEIQPITLNFTVDVPTNQRDFFGRRVYKNVQKTLASNTRKLHVQALPETGKPADFTGAVGQYQLAVESSKQELEAGESLDVKVKLSGDGNLKLLELPELSVSNAFEVYAPDHAVNTSTNLSGMHGSITDTYTLVPHSQGNYSVKPLSFSYFDPKSDSYKTLRSDELKIKVEGGMPQAQDQQGTGDSTVRKQKVATAGTHFQYIKMNTRLKPIDQPPFFRSTLFWVLLFLPLIIIPLVIIFGRQHLKRAQDFSGNRKRQANKLARKYLSEAKKTMGDQTAYYDALERALHNYLRAKLNLQTAEMNKERIEELLFQRQVSRETSHAFIDLLKNCEFARYTPPSDSGMQQDYNQAAEIISEVDKQLVKA